MLLSKKRSADEPSEDAESAADYESALSYSAFGRRPTAALAFWLDSERDRWFLWTPVAVSCGIGGYFALPSEPPPGVGLVALAGAVCLVALWRRKGLLAFPAFLLLFAALGFGVSDLRTWWVSAPVLDRPIASGISATVLEASPSGAGRVRLLLDVDALDARSTDETPARVRLTVPASHLPSEGALAGMQIEVFARLLPPPGPVAPGAFDYARLAYFERIGATGFSLGALNMTAPGGGLSDGFALARFRERLAARILSQLDQPAAGIAAALIVGERGAIEEPAADALRAAGLAHILAISGLHMALFAGTLFWALRACLAAVPAIALRAPIKKWAALGALVGGLFYLLISGAGIATQRAFVMLVVVLIAILLERPALTLRNVAIAALLILFWSPEALLSASFQMSFAAVTCLVAVYERGAGFVVGGDRDADRDAGAIGRFWRYLAALSLTSVIAGAATAPFAAFHFNRLAAYGLLGNLIAMPILGFLVMPMALVSLLLMPLGLDGLSLTVMGWGIDAILWAATFVEALPGAVARVPSGPIAALSLITFGGLWIALWARRPRWLGGIVVAAGITLWWAEPRPTVFVDRDGEGIGVVTADGLAVSPGVSDYVQDTWLRREALSVGAAQPMTCDSRGCVAEMADGRRIAFGRSLAAAAEDCALAEIVVSAVPLPRRIAQSCAAELLIDRRDLWSDGALAIYVAAGPDGEPTSRITTAREARGERPWSE